jgi:hypothetical protein
VLGFARQLGNSVIKRAYYWSLENYRGDFSVDLTWRQSDGAQKGGLIDRVQIAKIVDLIGLSSEKTTDTLFLNGILVGIDIKTRWFHFVVPDGDSFKGPLGPEFPTIGTIEVGKRYRAQIFVKSTLKFATETEEKKFSLLAIEANPDA